MADNGGDQVTVARGERVAEHPRVSVIIPSYRSHTLDQAIDSVRAQTFGAFEIIVVDDGSPEPQVPADQSDVVLVRQPNTGPGGARNRGAHLARGEFLAFLDSDDRWRPEKLARQVAFHDANPELVLSCPDIVLVTLDGVEVTRQSRRYGLREGVVSLDKLFCENCFATSGAMIPKSAFDRTAGFDPQRLAAEDYALWLRLAAIGSVGFLDEVLVEHVEHEASLTEQGQRAGRWHDAELEVYRNFLAEHPQFRGEPFVRAAFARAEFDRGYGCLQRGRRREAREAFLASLRQRPWRLKTWFNLARTYAPHRPAPEADAGR